MTLKEAREIVEELREMEILQNSVSVAAILLDDKGKELEKQFAKANKEVERLRPLALNGIILIALWEEVNAKLRIATDALKEAKKQCGEGQWGFLETVVRKALADLGISVKPIDSNDKQPGLEEK